jgi:hypothetical protein
MPRRPRPTETTRSEHWLRLMVNEHGTLLNRLIADALGWKSRNIVWQSPVRNDDFAEYYDQEFLDRLGVTNLQMPLRDFWPQSGPRWDGLATTEDGGCILVEAKAHIEEAVDYRSKASPDSLKLIHKRLDEAKAAFRANPDACWHAPLYQMANRLAHLYFLAEINKKDAYLVFLHFANAPDVDIPATREEWQGAIRLEHKCLGLKDSKLSRRMVAIIVDVQKDIGQQSGGAYFSPTADSKSAHP